MSADSEHNAKQVFLYYFSKIRKYPYSVFGVSVTLGFTVLVGFTLPPLVIANVLHRLISGQFVANQPWQSFGNDILLYGGLITLTGFITWRIVDLFMWRLQGNVERDIAQDVFNHLSEQSADFHANHFSGSLVSQTNKLVGSYGRMADTTLFTTMPLLFSLISTAVIMWPKSHLFVIILVLFAALFIGVALVVSRPVRAAGAILASAESKQTGYLADVIGNIMAVKSFANEKYEQLAYGRITDGTFSKMQTLRNAHMKQMMYFSGVSRAISTAAFALAILSVVKYKADISTVFLILSYSSIIVEQLFQFSNGALRNYNRSIGDATEMVKILSSEIEIKDPMIPIKPVMDQGDIQFIDVNFTHKGADEPIFQGLNMHINPGEKVGLVGHSGSGKTSLTRILLRFSDIDSGAIEIDGQNIASVTQADLRRAISYVPQEPILFHRTIAENIAYGHTDATQTEVEAIAQKANADEFIQSLPKKYETVVGERGVKLSGGQRQRIAIARAMLKNAPILVLDEATSALDSESEALIQDALWKLMEGRTAIVIAHRLSTIQKMDRIIVLDNGVIVEEGSHKDLLKRAGVYAKLWDRQSGGFLDE
jgi:ATP-binding cassette, subfamily B, bacterial